MGCRSCPWRYRPQDICSSLIAIENSVPVIADTRGASTKRNSADVPSRGCIQSKGKAPPAVVSSKKVLSVAACAALTRKVTSIWRGAAVKRRRVLATPVSMAVRRTVSAKRSWYPPTVGRCGRLEGQTMLDMVNPSCRTGVWAMRLHLPSGWHRFSAVSGTAFFVALEPLSTRQVPQ